jgi:hypothetical protein
VGGALMFGRNLTALVRGALRRPGGSASSMSSRSRPERLRGETSAGTPAAPHPHVRPSSPTEGESLSSGRSS